MIKFFQRLGPLVLAMVAISACTAQYTGSIIADQMEVIGFKGSSVQSPSQNSWVIGEDSRIAYQVVNSVTETDEFQREIEEKLDAVLKRELNARVSDVRSIQGVGLNSILRLSTSVHANYLLVAEVYQLNPVVMPEQSPIAETNPESQVLMHFLGVDEGIMHGEDDRASVMPVNQGGVLTIVLKLYDVSSDQFLESVVLQPRRKLWPLSIKEQLDISVAAFVQQRFI